MVVVYSIVGDEIIQREKEKEELRILRLVFEIKVDFYSFFNVQLGIWEDIIVICVVILLRFFIN